MERNVKIAYVLTVLKNSWFWLGIWVFYYLLFTNYAGIGLIETGLILGMTLGEIPTGAIADLLGKKKTILISFLLMSIGLIGVGFVANYIQLFIWVFIAGLGNSFYSGSFEALVYDSLKEVKREKDYVKVISNVNSLLLIAPAIAGLLGGFIYNYSPRLPFILHGIFYFLGFVLSLFLIEPHVDTEKFTLKTFFEQTKHGFKQLTKSWDIRNQILLLLVIGGIVVIADESLNGFLGVEFGFSEKMAGIIWSIIYIASSLSSQYTSKLLKYFDESRSVLITSALIAGTFIFSPYLGILLGGISLLLRSSLQSIFNNLSSIIINKNTESKYRATTLSTFNMLKNVPYVLFAYFIGYLADLYTSKMIAFWFGIVLLVILAVALFRRRSASL